MVNDLNRLGAWRDLAFFDDDLPGIAERIAQDERTVLPPAHLIFAALEQTQPDDVKAVILGQDPYPQPGKAQGLAFSIAADFPPRNRRDSLDNIFAELEADTGQPRQRTDLSDWAAQGVLLLNALALTVPQNKAAGHRKLGWQTLTAQVLQRLSTRPRAYLLWGADAHKAGADIDATTNLVIKSSHPSPMSVAKAGTDFEAFKGAKPFSRTNDWLHARGQNTINWANPEDP